jgi:hypothetical protein
MVDVARCKEMCTPPALLATGRCAGSTDCAARLRKTVSFTRKLLNYLMFFFDGDFVISA